MKKAAWKMKRMLSVVLAVAMVVTMLPTSLGGGMMVSAAETSDITADTEPNNTEGEILDSEESKESEDEYEETEGKTGSLEEEPIEQEPEKPAQPEEEEPTNPADPEEGLDAAEETPVDEIIGEEADVTAQSVPAQTELGDENGDPAEATVVKGGLWGLLKILKASDVPELKCAVWESSAPDIVETGEDPQYVDDEEKGARWLYITAFMAHQTGEVTLTAYKRSKAEGTGEGEAGSKTEEVLGTYQVSVDVPESATDNDIMVSYCYNLFEEDNCTLVIENKDPEDADKATKNLSDADIKTILQAEKAVGAEYDKIHLNPVYDQNAVIDKDIYNTVIDLLVDKSEWGVLFRDDDNNNRYTWTFQHPKKIDSNIPIGVNIETPAGDNQGIKVTLKKDLADAVAAAADGEVSIAVSLSDWLVEKGNDDGPNVIKDSIFGDREVALRAFIEDGSGITGLEDGLWAYCGGENEVFIGDIRNFTGDVTYRLLLCEGDMENEDATKISITPGEKKSITNLLGAGAPSGAEWQSLDDNVIKVEQDSSSGDQWMVEAVNGGDAYLIATTTSGGTKTYKAYRIYVSYSPDTYEGRVEFWGDDDDQERVFVVSYFDVSAWEDLPKDKAVEILEERAKTDNEKFDVVKLEFSRKEMVIDKDVVNAAKDLLYEDSEENHDKYERSRIDYSFSEAVFKGDEWDHHEETCWHLQQPKDMSADITTDIEVEEWDSGLAVTIAESLEPCAEWTDVNVYDTRWRSDEDGRVELDVFEVTSNQITKWMESFSGNFYRDSDGGNYYLDNVGSFTAGSQYLAAFSEELPETFTNNKEIAVKTPAPLTLDESLIWNAVNGSGQATFVYNSESKEGETKYSITINEAGNGNSADAFLYSMEKSGSDSSEGDTKTAKIYRVNASSAYKGRVEYWGDDDDQERVFMVSYFDVPEWEDLPKDKAVEILKERAATDEEKFDVVRLEFSRENNMVIDKDVVNAAKALLHEVSEENQDSRIDYSFHKAFFIGDEWDHHEETCWHLHQPKDMSEDITTGIEVEEWDNGIAVKITGNLNPSAEWINVDVNDSRWYGDGDYEEFDTFEVTSNQMTKWMEDVYSNFDNNEGSGWYTICNVGSFTAGTQYLVARSEELPAEFVNNKKIEVKTPAPLTLDESLIWNAVDGSGQAAFTYDPDAKEGETKYSITINEAGNGDSADAFLYSMEKSGSDSSEGDIKTAKIYRVNASSAYNGRVHDDYGQHVLEIDYHHVPEWEENLNLPKEKVVKILQDRAENEEEKFEVVRLEFPRGEMVIDKDIVNAARVLLYEDSEENREKYENSRIEYVFSEDFLVDEEWEHSEETCWQLHHPKNMSADITTGIEVEEWDNGIAVKIAGNLNPSAEWIDVDVNDSRWHGDGDYEEFDTFEVTSNQIAKWMEYVYSYFDNNEGSGGYSIGNVGSFTAGTQYLVARSEELPAEFANNKKIEVKTPAPLTLDESLIWNAVDGSGQAAFTYDPDAQEGETRYSITINEAGNGNSADAFLYSMEKSSSDASEGDTKTAKIYRVNASPAIEEPTEEKSFAELLQMMKGEKIPSDAIWESSDDTIVMVDPDITQDEEGNWYYTTTFMALQNGEVIITAYNRTEDGPEEEGQDKKGNRIGRYLVTVDELPENNESEIRIDYIFWGEIALAIDHKDGTDGIASYPNDNQSQEILGKILDNTDVKFDYIAVNLQYSDGAVINKDTYKAAADLLDSDYENRRIAFAFRETTEAPKYNEYVWEIKQPNATIAENIPIKSSVEIATPDEANQGIQLTLKNKIAEKLAAATGEGEVSLAVALDAWLDEGVINEGLFGGRDVQVKAFQETADGIDAFEGSIYAWCDQRTVFIGNMQQLSPGENDSVTYRLLLCEGDTDNENVDSIYMMPGEKRPVTDLPNTDSLSDAEWKSLDEYVAKVEKDTTEDEQWMVEAVGGGDAYLIATTTTGSTKTYKAYRIFVNYTEDTYEGDIEYRYEDGRDIECLNISYHRVLEWSDKNMPKAKVLSILKKYAEDPDRKFGVVRLDFSLANSEGKDYRLIDQDVVNAASELLDTTFEGRRIEYSFSGDDSGYFNEYTWELRQPRQLGKDIVAEVAIEEWNNGFTIKATGQFSLAANQVNFWYVNDKWNQDSEKYGNKDEWQGLDLFKVASNGITTWMRDNYCNFDGWGYYISDMTNLGSDQYLVAFCEEGLPDDFIINNQQIEVRKKVPLKLSDTLIWNAVNGSGKVEFSTNEQGVSKYAINISKKGDYETPDAFLYSMEKQTAKPTQGDAKTAKIYKVYANPAIAEKLFLQNSNESFKKNPETGQYSLTMELGYDYDNERYDTSSEEYLKILFSPSWVECDGGDTERVKWETSAPDVVKLGHNDDDPDREDGGIIALQTGTATIKATYRKNTEIDWGVNPDNEISVECVVTVIDPIVIEEFPDDLFAVTNFTTKLSEIEIPDSYWKHSNGPSEKGHWEWVDGDINLSQYAAKGGASFATKFRTEGGRIQDGHTLYVNIYTLTGVSIVAFNEPEEGQKPSERDVPVAVENGKKVSFGYRFETSDWEWDEIVDRYSNNEIPEVTRNLLKSYQDRIQTVWSSKPASAASKQVEGKDGYAPGDISYRFVGELSKNKAEKKTLTVSIKDTKNNNKEILKATHNITVTVNPIADLRYYDQGGDVFGHWYDEKENELHLEILKKAYDDNPNNYDLTFSSNDTAILKIDNKKATRKTVAQTEERGEGEDKTTYSYYDFTVPGTIVSNGMAYFTVTASDEVKSSMVYALRFVDREPKLENSTVTVNKNQDKPSADIVILTGSNTTLNTPTLDGAGSELFDLIPNGEPDDVYNRYKLSVKTGANLAKNKYTFSLGLPVSWSEDNEDEGEPKPGSYTYTATLTVKVEAKTPAVTIKQTQKVNTYYEMTSEKGYGLLTVNTGGVKLDTTSIRLSSDCEFKIVSVEGNADEGYKCWIQRTMDKPTKKKGTLTYKLEGYTEVSKNLSIGVASTKPAVVLSPASDTLYTKLGYKTSTVTLTNKADGTPMDVTSVIVKGQGTSSAAFSEDVKESTVDTKNNKYTVKWDEKAVLNFTLKDDPVNETFKFKIEVKVNGSDTPITVNYSLKVDTAVPTPVLNPATVTLNKNEAIWRNQQVKTALQLKGCGLDFMDMVSDGRVTMDITAKTEASDDFLKVYYDDYRNMIVANFNENVEQQDIKKGTYQYTVSMRIQGEEETYEKSTALKIKVVDATVDKSLKVTAKGSIDIFDREGTSIVYTPKLSNLAGEIEWINLEGAHSGLFELYDLEDGTFEVKAREGHTFVTNATYQVTAKFGIDVENYSRYQITQVLKIKVKQGKPKITVSSPNGNTLYRQLQNEIEIKFDAKLKQKNVEIETVRLLNYTDDIDPWRPNGFTVYEDGGEQHQDPCWGFNPDTQTIRLSTCDESRARAILKSGKTWNLKFMVRYRDQAGNVKNTQVTYKVVVR